MTEQPLLAPVILPRTLHAEIVAHARAGKPEEVCGVLQGRGLTAHTLHRGRNVATDRINNYEVDPQTLLLQFDFEDQGDEMMGIYHSHPISVAYPSATDAWSAHYPDSVYLICSLEYDDAPVIRAFQLMAEPWAGGLTQLLHALPFTEVRPGLFGYFQAEGDVLPPLLADAAVQPPFYVVYAVDEASGVPGAARVVAVREHALVEAAAGSV